ncbi:MAG: DUF4396 domain-containing protein [bacterium]
MKHTPKETKKLAFKITLHCLAGCGSGDVLGLIIGTSLSWPVFPTMILGIVLGFLGGYSLVIIPLLKRGMTFKQSTKIAVVGETASIFVMETAENVTAFLIPGLLTASIFAPLFWFGFIISVMAGFIVAYPVNYVLLNMGAKDFHHH